MTRHISDQPRTQNGARRARAFMQIERGKQSAGHLKALRTQPRNETAARLREFLRIERERTD